MSTASDSEEDHTLDSLWEVACEWVDLLTPTFGEPAQLASVGLSRRLALQCRNWLWSIEGLVRRILIAAALAFDPRKLSPLRPAPHAEATSARRPAGPRPSRFTLFAFANPRPQRPRAATTQPRPYGHVPLPADSLLRIGAPCERQVRRSEPGETSATPHLLRRHGRISRWDPEFRLAPARLSTSVREPTPRTSPRQRYAPASALHVLPDLTDWRRVEAEWQRTLPAPHLATRIAALLRIVDQPARWIRRLARRLHGGNLAARLILQPPPHLRRPRLDRTPPPPLQEELALAHAFLDTS